MQWLKLSNIVPSDRGHVGAVTPETKGTPGLSPGTSPAAFELNSVRGGNAAAWTLAGGAASSRRTTGRPLATISAR